MARCVVTGAAGFIGSHLSEALVSAGHDVVGIDSFCPYYSVEQKWGNVKDLLLSSRFDLVSAPLREVDLRRRLEGAEWVFHHAAQPGVGPSWGDLFAAYLEDNLLTTKLLLEACVQARVSRFVFASSSSVYGSGHRGPVTETAPLSPMSPYAVTKLASEQLCHCFARGFGLRVIILRYFTAYGPRQRPDMAFSRFFKQISKQQPVVIFGDGRQSRDFTFVHDTVRANLALIEAGVTSGTFNIGSNRSTSVLDAVEIMARITGARPQIEFEPKAPGDPAQTLADISRARNLLGYIPSWTLEKGLAAQWAWMKQSRLQQTTDFHLSHGAAPNVSDAPSNR